MIELELRQRFYARGGTAIDLNLKAVCGTGGCIGLFGPSGAGKTTLLRFLAGLFTPHTGSIRVDGEYWFDSENKIALPAQARGIGMVFQDYALFPNLNVFDNVAYSLDGKAKRYAAELIERFALSEFSQRGVHTLSGGQKQRVALARALARRPKILLLDEPFSALDHDLRRQLQFDLQDIQQSLDITTFLVTHDLADLFSLCSEVLCLENGMIRRQGSPKDLFLQATLSNGVDLQAQILDIRAHDVVQVVSLLIGNHTVQILASPQETAGIKTGDRIAVSAQSLAMLPQRRMQK